MIKFKTFFLVFLSLIFTQLYSQSPTNLDQAKTSTALTNYFQMDRENIHLHLNKNTFLTDEDIWFKAYIIEKKTNIAYVATSNVYISLIDANGKKIATQLFFSENSVFNGRIKLNPQLPTGKYYLQVFTNYMNNFSEDESSIYDIAIINPAENNYFDSKKNNYSDLEIEFYPESGTFLEGVSNTIGVKIIDCNANGIMIKGGEIVDSKGNLVVNFSTNQFGYGRFEILATNNEVYKAIMNINETKIEKKLPIPSLEGISYSINNYTFKDKTTIKLKTNSRTLAEIKNVSHTLVIQQNQAVSYVPFAFKDNETERAINISSEKLLEGINTIYLINSKGEKMGERIIYKPFITNNKIDLIVAQKRNDSIVISGQSTMILSNLSISILPSESVSQLPEKSIYSAFQFDNFLSSSIKNSNYYINDFSRAKHYELDNFLITQKSKYNWDTILGNPPQEKYTFDSGLTLKGTVNNNLTVGENYRINMSSIVLGISQTTSVNEKNEFLFENVFAIDSTAIHFSLINKKLKQMELKLYCQISNNNRKFLKPFKINTKECVVITKNPFSDSSPFPTIQNAILLDSINIFSKKKKLVLSNTLNYNNSAAKGFKITENVAANFRDVLGFIRTHGYNVSVNGTEVIITRTFSNSFRGDLSPAIFLDDIPVNDFSFLLNYNLDTVDEIYVNKMGYGSGMTAPNGTIRIYSKTPGEYMKNNIKIKSKPFVVKDGFQPTAAFENPKYGAIHSDSFLKFGTIHWKPEVETDKNGAFNFSIPNMYQNTVKVIIEGISSDGRLISETKTLQISE